MDVLPGPVQGSRIRPGPACPCTRWGCRRTTCRCVGDDHGVGLEPVRVLLDEGTEVRRAGLLLALDQQLQVDRRGGPARGGEVGADAECVEEHLPLVVGRPARVEAALADLRLEGVAGPAVLAGGGLNVVVPVQRTVGAWGSSAGQSAKTAGAPRSATLGGGESGLQELGREPLGAAAHVRRVLGLGGHRRDAQPLHEVVEEGGTVVVDVRADGTVRGLAHGHEPIRPRRHPRPPAPRRRARPAAASPARPGRVGPRGVRPPPCGRTGTRP